MEAFVHNPTLPFQRYNDSVYRNIQFFSKHIFHRRLNHCTLLEKSWMRTGTGNDKKVSKNKNQLPLHHSEMWNDIPEKNRKKWKNVSWRTTILRENIFEKCMKNEQFLRKFIKILNLKRQWTICVTCINIFWQWIQKLTLGIKIVGNFSVALFSDAA